VRIMDKVLLIGAGGNARTVISLLKKTPDKEIAGLIECDETAIGRLIMGVRVIGTDNQLQSFYQKGYKQALITLGSVGDNSPRERLFFLAKSIGFEMINALHPSTIISDDVTMGEGNIIMAGAIVNYGVKLGNNTLVNSGAIVEHDCEVGDHVHIGPGAKVAGGVQIGDKTHVGIGAIIIQGIKIGKDVLIGAGAVVLRDVPDGTVIVGNPGRILKNRYQ
jgi:sugar O-acyltransferase (sialic acid O-acetyltransferase NeuD family)